jgi:hypothetical protein
MFEMYYNQLMQMRKAEIARQGAIWGVVNGAQSTLDYLVKHYTKVQLARFIADRVDRFGTHQG